MKSLSTRIPWQLHCLILALMFGLISLRPIYDADLFVQLAAGRFALEHFSAPHTDFFLYVNGSMPQIFGGWGFGALYQFFINAFGYASTSFLNSFIWGGVFYFLIAAFFLPYSSGASRRSPLGLSAFFLAAFCFCAWAISTRMNMRAECTFYLAWAIGYYLMRKTQPTSSPRYFLLGLPLACWAVAWLHTGGFLLLLLYPIAFGRHISSLGSGATFRHTIGLWALSFCFAIALPCANPNGFMQVYSHPYYNALQAAKALNFNIDNPDTRTIISVPYSRDDPSGPHVNIPIVNTPVEYLPMTESRMAHLRPVFAAVAGGFLICLMGFAIAQRRSLAYVAETSVIALLLSVAFIHSRAVGLAALALAIPLADTLLLAFNRPTGVPPALPWRSWTLILLSSIAIYLCVGFENIGIQSRTLPYRAAAEAIKLHSPNGARIFLYDFANALFYQLGDKYTIGHTGNQLNPNPQSNSHYYKILAADIEMLSELDSHKVDYVCLPYFVNVSGVNELLWPNSVLASSPKWKVLIFSEGCMLSMRLPDDKPLDPSQSTQQTIQYLEGLLQLSSNNFSVYRHDEDRKIAELAQNKLNSLHAARDRQPPTLH